MTAARRLCLALLPLILGATPGRDAVAHEKGVLTAATRAVAPGDSLPLTGGKFGAASRLKLVLVGVAGRYELATVRADTAGAFRATLAVPDTLPTGDYRLVAIAADGDEVAGLDLAVHARAEAAEVEAHATDEHHDMAGEPSAEPLALERARSPWVTGGAVLLIGLVFVTGLALLRRKPPVHA